MLIVQGVVLVIALGWIVVGVTGHSHGWSWAAPPIGLVLGMGLPLQAVVPAVSRAARP